MDGFYSFGEFRLGMVVLIRVPIAGVGWGGGKEIKGGIQGGRLDYNGCYSQILVMW